MLVKILLIEPGFRHSVQVFPSTLLAVTPDGEHIVVIISNNEKNTTFLSNNKNTLKELILYPSDWTEDKKEIQKVLVGGYEAIDSVHLYCSVNKAYYASIKVTD